MTLQRSVFDVIRFDYSPASRAANETVARVPVFAGDIVLVAYSIPVVASTTANTVSLGHTGSVDRFTAARATDGGTAGTPVDGQTAAFPRVILVDQNLNVDYIAVGGGGTVTPIERFVVCIFRAPRL